MCQLRLTCAVLARSHTHFWFPLVLSLLNSFFLPFFHPINKSLPVLPPPKHPHHIKGRRSLAPGSTNPFCTRCLKRSRKEKKKAKKEMYSCLHGIQAEGGTQPHGRGPPSAWAHAHRSWLPLGPVLCKAGLCLSLWHWASLAARPQAQSAIDPRAGAKHHSQARGCWGEGEGGGSASASAWRPLCNSN